MRKQEKLQDVFSKVYKRYCSIFFSKMVLLDTQQQNEEVSHIRHYDNECQAVTTIACVLQTKIKAVRFKFLHCLKQFVQENKKQKEHSRKTFTRSSVDRRSFSKKSRGVMSVANLRSNSKDTTYTGVYLKPSLYKRAPKDEFQQIDHSMKQLMEKVKNFNSKNKKQGINEYGIMSNQQSQKIRQKKLILSKMSKLENDLQNFFGQNLKLDTHLEKHSKIRPGTEYFDRPIKVYSPRTPHFTYEDTYNKR